MVDTEVLVIGAGPVGLMLAVELRRQGVTCRVVEKLAQRSDHCKAIGIQPRVLELFERAGVLEEAVSRGIWIKGQEVFVNGQPAVDQRLPTGGPAALMGLPYGFLGLPQYDTEDILARQLAVEGVEIERGLELTGFEDRGDHVAATLVGSDGGERVVTATYLAGCDGAHSTARKSLQISFDGDRLAEEFMLADVEIDGPMEHGMPYRFLKKDGDTIRNMLVCIPLPGRSRFRLSTIYSGGDAPPADLSVHYAFLGHRPAPTAEDFEAVLDDMALPGTRIANMRWSSIFGISHRLAARYRKGNGFLLGDAAHIHAPSGAQGMNTGIQDSTNLAWKFAAVLRHGAPEALLDTYEAERRPVGSEVVQRVKGYEASQHVGDRGGLAEIYAMAQISVTYRDAPGLIETGVGEDCPVRAGDRAPDAGGIVREGFGHLLRLRELSTGPCHVLVTCAGPAIDMDGLRHDLESLRSRFESVLLAYVMHEQGVMPPVDYTLEVADGDGRYANAFGAKAGTTLIIRPDGHVGYRAELFDMAGLAAYLESVAGPGTGSAC
jgi:pentachlorophenol monooxygenase